MSDKQNTASPKGGTTPPSVTHASYAGREEGGGRLVRVAAGRSDERCAGSGGGEEDSGRLHAARPGQCH